MHYSTDYVFDGTAPVHTEDEHYSPLGVYAQTKAAGDIAVATTPRHYIVRTSWVIGDGHNFVRTMQQLAADGVSPTVVHDQVGRLTFTPDLSRATRHLVDAGRRTASTTSRLRPGHVVGRPGQGGVPAQRPRRRRRHARDHRGVRRRPRGHLAAT